MDEAPRSRWPIRKPLDAALIAALLGIVSCRYGVSWSGDRLLVYSDHAGASTLVQVILRFAPYAGAALITGVTYAALTRGMHASTEIASGHPIAARNLTARGTTALRMVLAITGACAALGAVFVGFWFSGGGDGPPPATTGAAVGNFASGVISGALLGAGVGIILAVPAALVVWFVDINRRR